MILVSIIVPIYNVENYLDRCVESIIRQTYKNVEIILVDDGSLDNSPQMCDEWAKKDERIVVIHKKNGGLSDARNAGLKIASGEYIGFVDSDDWIEPEFCEMLVEKLDSGADIADCATRLCDENNNTILVRGFSEDVDLDTVDALKTLISEKGIMQTVWNKLYKKSCIDDILFEYGKYHEDNFWTWKVFSNSSKVSVISKPLYNYLQRSGSIMGTNYSLIRLDGLEANYECFSLLKSDENYREIVIHKFIKSCMYNLQCTYKYLKGSEKQQAKKIILDYLEKSIVEFNNNELNSIWQKAFIKLPIAVSIIRNILKIGL